MYETAINTLYHTMGAGAFSEEGGQVRNWRGRAEIPFTLAPLLSSLLTLDFVFWVGKSSSLCPNH